MFCREEKPVEFFNHGRSTEGSEAEGIKLVDASSGEKAEYAVVTVTAHDKMLTDFEFNWLPRDVDINLVPVILKRAADKIEAWLLQQGEEGFGVQRGEIVKHGGVEHICVDTIAGHTSPTLVTNWCDPKAWEAPLQCNSVGEDKTPVWAATISQNLPKIKRGVKDLYGTGKGKGLIICGSGPSLQIDYLKNLKGKKWDVLATNASYGLLDCNADYAMFNETHAKAEWVEKVTPRATCLNSIYSSVFVGLAPWSRMYWFASWPPKQKLEINTQLGEKLGFLHEQLNVTASALSFAYQAGYEKVVLVGCDFAYTNGQSHYGEPVDDERMQMFKGYFSYGRTVDGGEVLTDRMLATQARCHEAMAHWLTKAGLEVYNCTEGGIMTGMNCKPLAEVIGEDMK